MSLKHKHAVIWKSFNIFHFSCVGNILRYSSCIGWFFSYHQLMISYWEGPRDQPWGELISTSPHPKPNPPTPSYIVSLGGRDTGHDEATREMVANQGDTTAQGVPQGNQFHWPQMLRVTIWNIPILFVMRYHPAHGSMIIFLTTIDKIPGLITV